MANNNYQLRCTFTTIFTPRVTVSNFLSNELELFSYDLSEAMVKLFIVLYFSRLICSKDTGWYSPLFC